MKKRWGDVYWGLVFVATLLARDLDSHRDFLRREDIGAARPLAGC